MRFLFFIVLIFGSYCACAQTISGYVYDEEENKPLEGAFVYLDGTTLSASTDARGFFRIVTAQKYNASLVISFVGFETLRIDDPYKYQKPFKALLRTDAIALDELVITKGGPFTRKQMLKVFREQFLGTTRTGSSCEIENEDDITIYFDLSTNTLRARALKPIKITNKRLEYKINFDLVDFEVNYNYKSLEKFNMTRSFFAGTTFFTDISKNNGAAKKRKEVYLGSVTHLMRTIAANDWEKQTYRLFYDKYQVDHNRYLSVTDSLSYKKVCLAEVPEELLKRREEIAAGRMHMLTKKSEKTPTKYGDVKFSVLYNMDQQSSITFNNGYFYIDQNGLYFPLSELTFGGYMGDLKAGDLLPANYVYTP